MGCGATHAAETRIRTVPDEDTVPYTHDTQEELVKVITQPKGIVQDFVLPCSVDECTSNDRYSFDSILAFLASVPALRLIAKVDMLPLVKEMTRHEHSCGELIVEQGEANKKLFIILNGEAKVSRVNDTSKILLATLHSGDYFGEQEMFHPENARTTIRASGGASPSLVTCSIAHSRLKELGLEKWLRMPRRQAIVDWKTAKRVSVQFEQLGLQSTSPKTQEEKEFIATALRRNVNLCPLYETDKDIVPELVASASLYTLEAGEVLLRQGDLLPTPFYIVQRGSLEIRARRSRNRHCIVPFCGDANDVRCTQAMPGESFGEVGLLYSAPCEATVTTLEETSIWMIQPFDFIDIMADQLSTKLAGYIPILRNVEFFVGLLQEELEAMAEVVTELWYARGEDVITQGEVGHTFYMLVEGNAIVISDGKEVRKLSASCEGTTSHFGEMELIEPRPRDASVCITSETAKVLALPKASFEMVLEPFADFLDGLSQGTLPRPSISKRSKNASKRIASKRTSASKSISNPNSPSAAAEWKSSIFQADLHLCGRLGSGGFGLVDLVVDRKSKKQYALKRIFRDKVVEEYQQNQILLEKKILMLCTSPFVISLHATFRDATTLAFLLEFAPGGDLMDVLHNFKLHGNADCARFFCAGVILATEHLHQLQIIFRDLKPENILLDANGWPKLIDFGLAKICPDKSFTCCGTPCYMAPEMWLRIGHDRAIDWWALGILAYEIMSGRTPFENDDGDDDAMRESIEQGMTSAWDWPIGFSSELKSWLTGLLKPFAPQRLGMQAEGVASIKNHAWYASVAFNWESYESRTQTPPHSKVHRPISTEDLPPSPTETMWPTSDAPAAAWDADF
jgi:serine/threonine protein kinase